MYHRFIEQISEFIFAEDEPEKADIIFIPGNGYSQMAEKAAALYGENYASFVLPSGKYSITVGKFGGVLSGQERYNGNYRTEWDFLKDVLIKNHGYFLLVSIASPPGYNRFSFVFFHTLSVS